MEEWLKSVEAAVTLLEQCWGNTVCSIAVLGAAVQCSGGVVIKQG